MNETTTVIVAVHAMIAVIQFVAMKFTTISRTGGFGIYLILMPVGFLAFESTSDVASTVTVVLLGVGLVLFSLRRGSVRTVPLLDEARGAPKATGAD